MTDSQVYIQINQAMDVILMERFQGITDFTRDLEIHRVTLLQNKYFTVNTMKMISLTIPSPPLKVNIQFHTHNKQTINLLSLQNHLHNYLLQNLFIGTNN